MSNKNKSKSSIIINETSLQQLGWSDEFANKTAELEQPKGSVARLTCVQRNFFTVNNGEDEWLCTPAGKLMYNENGMYPVTGDWVLVDDTVVTGIIPRKNILSRGESGARGGKNVSVNREQPIAANLDTIFIVCGLDRDYNLRRLERYLTLIYNCGLTPVVVLTKADLHEEPENFLTEVESIAFGVDVVLTSMQDKRGKHELEEYLRGGQTAAMIGSSGAGKSTLANMLYGEDIQLTRTISDSVGKGRHTTTSRELVCMPQGGMLMDNPGIREIAFHESGDGIENTFSDIQELAVLCRFSDCTHANEPGCEVLHAVKTGELPVKRLENFHKMKREMDYISARQKKSANRVEKERRKDISLMIKDMKKKKE